MRYQSFIGGLEKGNFRLQEGMERTLDNHLGDREERETDRCFLPAVLVGILEDPVVSQKAM